MVTSVVETAAVAARRRGLVLSDLLNFLRVVVGLSLRARVVSASTKTNQLVRD